VSEARQLIAKAWVQLSKQELARAKLDTADALCKRAAELDPVDAVVWATWTHVHSWMTHYRLDRTESRRAVARDCAAKAMRLDPDSFEARLAQAVFWTRGSGAGRTPETDQLLRALVQEACGDDAACLQIAGRCFMAKKASDAEGRALLERLAANPNYTALAWVEIGWELHNRDKGASGRPWRRLKISIAAKPYWHNLGLKAQIAATWLGDVDLALAALFCRCRKPSSRRTGLWGRASGCSACAASPKMRSPS